jgi:hypothetical protein
MQIPGTPPGYVMACVAIDLNAFVLDTKTTSPTLRLVVPISNVFGAILNGAVNGVNATFTLPATPLAIYRNGLRQQLGIDYTFKVGVITFTPVSIPQLGDVVTGDYRH